MTTSLETAFEAIKLLSDKFSAHSAAFTSPEFSEASLRQEFLDDFLTALGWDVAGRKHPNPFEREVRVERSVAVGLGKKRADYALYVKPNFRDVRLFIEAKKPGVALATQDNYFQTARYGWSSNTPLAVLTNFRELHVIDCRYRPDIDTVLEIGATSFKYTYTDLNDFEKFSEIYWLMSREAVVDGSLQKISEALPKKRGKGVQKGAIKGGFQSIDDAFLEDLDVMRDELARSLKNRNNQLDGSTLTEVTQRVLDRLVFLRFLEDKLIETQERVADFGSTGSAWTDFVNASRRLDTKYNGVVFKAHRLIDGKGAMHVDDKVFGAICRRIAHVNSPYDFNAIPIHILGSIYERFLGKVITTTDKRATLEEKPEVRKAGGVFYTPSFVVQMIVDQTVGVLIEGCNPKEISKMRFADIACGSGSFLLGAYDTLLRYHTGWYNKQNGKDRARFIKSNQCSEHEDGSLHLTLSKRREILLNNIYGVDIDPQATEVAQVSLYLKLLEEETTATARNYQMEMGAALLPSLSRNVACGNSLVEPDILTPPEAELFEVSMEEERALSPMDFAIEFPEVFKKDGGFDAIVGNPPWGAAFSDLSKAYFRTKYEKVHVRTPESFNYFVFRMHSLLKSDGAMGVIVPSSFLTQHEFWKTRELLVKAGVVKSVVNLGDGVFQKVTAPSCIVVANKTKNVAAATVLDLRGVSRAELPDALLTRQGVEVAKIGLNSPEFTLSTGGRLALMRRMAQLPTLRDVAQEVATGVSSGLDAAYVYTEAQLQELKIEREITKKLVIGGEIHRFRLSPVSTKRILYLTGEDDLDKHPNALKVLSAHKPRLKLRREAANGKIAWFELNWPRRKKLFEEHKILIRQTAPRIMAAMDTEGWYCLKSGLVVQLPEGSGIDYPYLLGVLNSKLIGYFYNELVGEQGRVFPEVKPVQLFKLPIKVPDNKNKNEMELAAKLRVVVTQMCDASQKKAGAMTERDLKFFEAKCAQLERQIDALVYQIYGVSKADIDAVEQAMPA